MPDFEDRKKAFEKKFQHDEARSFQSQVRAAKALGAWAAVQMNMADAEADLYVKGILEVALASGAQDALFAGIAADLGARGIATSPRQVAGRYADIMDDVRAAWMAEDELAAQKKDELG